MNLPTEFLEKAKTATSPEELMQIANAEKIEITTLQATEYFAMLNQEVELADEELSCVSGGAIPRRQEEPTLL